MVVVRVCAFDVARCFGKACVRTPRKCRRQIHDLHIRDYCEDNNLTHQPSFDPDRLDQKGMTVADRGEGSARISFEQARAIAATSSEVLRWYQPGSVEIAEWGWENSRDYMMVGRNHGEPWWHEMPVEKQPIPGPPMIVVSKATGAVSTFIGATVPDYYRENPEEETPIGDAPD
jgi:hypothetical protein